MEPYITDIVAAFSELHDAEGGIELAHMTKAELEKVAVGAPEVVKATIAKELRARVVI